MDIELICSIIGAVGVVIAAIITGVLAYKGGNGTTIGTEGTIEETIIKKPNETENQNKQDQSTNKNLEKEIEFVKKLKYNSPNRDDITISQQDKERK